MKTLKEIIVERKCRKGAADGTTKDGAYWIPVSCKIDCAGGDGIGQNSASISWWLTIRHYRSGEVRAYLVCKSWHQNTGTEREKVRADAVLDCTTIEDLVIAIKKHAITDEYNGESVQVDVDNHFLPEIAKAIPELPESVPGPDA